METTMRKSDPIKKKVGQQMLFTGGAEYTPRVQVSTFRCVGSLHNGDKNLLITQNGEGSVSLSVETMEAILKWAKEE
jgi:hypothetical protein